MKKQNINKKWCLTIVLLLLLVVGCDAKASEPSGYVPVNPDNYQNPDNPYDDEMVHFKEYELCRNGKLIWIAYERGSSYGGGENYAMTSEIIGECK